MTIAELRTRIQSDFDPSALNDRTRTGNENQPRTRWKILPQSVFTPANQNDGEPRAETDPIIQALVDRLPQPNAIWSIDDRGKWLKAAAMAFNLIYKTE